MTNPLTAAELDDLAKFGEEAKDVRVRKWVLKAADVGLVQVVGGPHENITPFMHLASIAPEYVPRLVAEVRRLRAVMTNARHWANQASDAMLAGADDAVIGGLQCEVCEALKEAGDA